MRYQEVIIIGASRSGTNMLRDVLCRLPGFGTWPCDEINAIWRHGNVRWPSDELPATLATPRVAAYLNRQFARRARRDSLEFVVEKTCANSLRVPFLDRALPNARYLFIHRQPVDAVASAMKRWRAPLDLPYTLRKARFVPLTDLPYYGWWFFRNRLRHLTSAERSMRSWGPRFEGMDEFSRHHPLSETCARQWSACVDLAATALAAMPTPKVHVIRYEDFVTDPLTGLRAVDMFLGAGSPTEAISDAIRDVTDTSINRGRHELEKETRERILALAAPGIASLAALT